MKNDITVQNNTCFKACIEYGVSCLRNNCRNWICSEHNKNCVMLAAKSGPKTLQEIGDIFKLTRMRICQIEKAVYAKISLSQVDDEISSLEEGTSSEEI